MKTIALYAALLILLAVFGGIGYLAYDSYLHDKDSTPQATEEPATKPATKKPKTKYDIGAPDPQEMLELVNMERAKVGVAPLVIDENVQKSAQLKSDHMLEHGYYQHNIPGTNYTLTDEMAMYVRRSCVSSGENIGAGDDTSQSAVDGWMKSQPHREAILNPDYTLTGFGVSSRQNDPYANRLDYHYQVQHLCIAR